MAFVRWVKDHPRESMHPQGATDATGDQVSVPIISGEMCQSDKTKKGLGKKKNTETDSDLLLNDKI